MKKVFRHEFALVGIVAVLLAAVSVLAVFASRTEPDIKALQGSNPAAPIAKPIPAPTDRTAP